jgi:Transcriptional regulators
VVGFDDMSGVDNRYPPLTTRHHDFEGLGVATMRETLRLLGEGGEQTINDNKARQGAIHTPRACPQSLGKA